MIRRSEMANPQKVNEALATQAKQIPATSEMVTLKEWADIGMKAGIVPQGTNPYQAMAIVQTGKEIGLQPMQSLRSMAFVKGRLTMAVQLQLALAKQRGVIIKEIVEKDGSCIATLVRGDEQITCEYTLDDAKKAGLTREGGAYEKYERQMLRWRAIGDALRLIAPDLVMGLLSPEEASSIEPVQRERPEMPENIEVQPAQSPPTQEILDSIPPIEPPKPKTKNYEFLKVMKNQKERVGDDIYYKILGQNGYEHADEITEKEAQKSIYKELVAVKI